MTKPKKLDQKERERIISKIIAYDIIQVLEEVDRGELQYLDTILGGEGYTVPGKMTDAELIEEMREGDYDGPVKREAVMESRHYSHPFIKQLWEKGTRDGIWSGGRFVEPGTPEYKQLAKKFKSQEGPMARGLWEDFNNKFGFGDGACEEERDYLARAILVRLLNKTKEFRDAKVRAHEFDRPGFHNHCLVVLVPASMTLKQWLKATLPEAKEPDVDYDELVARAYEALENK